MAFGTADGEKRRPQADSGRINLARGSAGADTGAGRTDHVAALEPTEAVAAPAARAVVTRVAGPADGVCRAAVAASLAALVVKLTQGCRLFAPLKQEWRC